MSKIGANGFIKLHRQLFENPIVCKDADHLAIWIYILLKATYTEYTELFNKQKIIVKPGQLITGRKKISEFLNITESKVQRVLKTFEIEQQIKQQTCSQNRLITIVNWSLYQTSEQQNKQRVNNKRTNEHIQEVI